MARLEERKRGNASRHGKRGLGALVSVVVCLLACNIFQDGWSCMLESMVVGDVVKSYGSLSKDGTWRSVKERGASDCLAIRIKTLSLPPCIRNQCKTVAKHTHSDRTWTQAQMDGSSLHHQQLLRWKIRRTNTHVSQPNAVERRLVTLFENRSPTPHRTGEGQPRHTSASRQP